jgi:hypothetical protein
VHVHKHTAEALRSLANLEAVSRVDAQQSCNNADKMRAMRKHHHTQTSVAHTAAEGPGAQACSAQQRVSRTMAHFPEHRCKATTAIGRPQLGGGRVVLVLEASRILATAEGWGRRGAAEHRV